MAFKTAIVDFRPRRGRAPDLYLIYKRRTCTVVGLWGNANYRDTVLRSLEGSFPGQYSAAAAWGRIIDGDLEVWFGEIISLPECYRQEFERAMRARLEKNWP